MDYISQFEKILDSNYRLIAMESYDVERIIDVFTRLTRFTNKAIYQWLPNQGMHRIGASHIIIPRTQSAKNVLEHVDNSPHYGVFVLRDFNAAMQDKECLALLKRIMAPSAAHKVIVLLGETVELPAELKPFTLRSRHQLRHAS